MFITLTGDISSHKKSTSDRSETCGGSYLDSFATSCPGAVCGRMARGDTSAGPSPTGQDGLSGWLPRHGRGSILGCVWETHHHAAAESTPGKDHSLHFAPLASLPVIALSAVRSVEGLQAAHREEPVLQQGDAEIAAGAGRAGHQAPAVGQRIVGPHAPQPGDPIKPTHLGQVKAVADVSIETTHGVDPAVQRHSADVAPAQVHGGRFVPGERERVEPAHAAEELHLVAPPDAVHKPLQVDSPVFARTSYDSTVLVGLRSLQPPMASRTEFGSRGQWWGLELKTLVTRRVKHNVLLPDIELVIPDDVTELSQRQIQELRGGTPNLLEVVQYEAEGAVPQVGTELGFRCIPDANAILRTQLGFQEVDAGLRHTQEAELFSCLQEGGYIVLRDRQRVLIDMLDEKSHDVRTHSQDAVLLPSRTVTGIVGAAGAQDGLVGLELGAFDLDDHITEFPLQSQLV
ncbi:hypothetical protein JZ751_016942 [Albula glossodonta]|uniref:Uncharacterized protein n=1 Tax=Albula glossodonta TaxID=121402 RepID=A0A8T2N0B5_9TELE|nr:hypothetical protein JZ751_016942 [Albula glossodonta]